RTFVVCSSPPEGRRMPRSSTVAPPESSLALTARRAGRYWLAPEMDERVERRRLLAAWSIVLLAGIAPRPMRVALHRAGLAPLAATPAWSPFDHLPRELLRDHLFGSLLLLQQPPPLSNLILGVALKWCSWPVGVAYTMIWLQTLMTILTAVVLVHVLSVLYP